MLQWKHMPMHQSFHTPVDGYTIVCCCKPTSQTEHDPLGFSHYQVQATARTRSCVAPRCFCLQWRTSVLQTSCILPSITSETSLPPPQLGCPQGHGTLPACTLHCQGHLSRCQIMLLPPITTGTAGHTSKAWLAPNSVMQTQGTANKPDWMLRQSD